MLNSLTGQLSAPFCLRNTNAIIPTLIPVLTASLDGRYVIRIEGGKLHGATPVPEDATLVNVNAGDSQQIAAMLSHVTQDMLDNDMSGNLTGAIVGLYDRLYPGPRPEFVD